MYPQERGPMRKYHNRRCDKCRLRVWELIQRGNGPALCGPCEYDSGAAGRFLMALGVLVALAFVWFAALVFLKA